LNDGGNFLKCVNCGKELNGGERYCKKCAINTNEADLPQKPPQPVIKKENQCTFAAILFAVSGIAVLVRMIKSWFDTGLKLTDASFALSIGLAAVFVFVCLNMYHPDKLKKLLKTLSIFLLVDLMWQIYGLVAALVKAFPENGTAVSITVAVALLPFLIYSFILPMHIIGVFKAKRILLFFLKVELLLAMVTPIFNIIGFRYTRDFTFSYFDTILSFFASTPFALATIIFITVLSYVKSRFKQIAV
jgi:hypothetical protein